MERNKEIYTTHWYIDGNGKPINDRVFDIDHSLKLRADLEKHLNPDLLRILDNQPPLVKDLANEPFYKINDGKGCPECLAKYKSKDESKDENKDEEKQIDLPL